MDEADEVSIRDVALMVAEGLGFEGEVVFDTTKADGQHKKTASNAKLRRYLPDFHFRPLRESIHQVCKWFADNYDSGAVRK